MSIITIATTKGGAGKTTLARLILGRAALSEVIAESSRKSTLRSVDCRAAFFRLAASAVAWLNRRRGMLLGSEGPSA